MFSGDVGRWHSYAGVCRAMYHTQNILRNRNRSDPNETAR